MKKIFNCLLHAFFLVKLINLITQFVEAFIVLAAGRLEIRTQHGSTRRLPTASANVAVSLLSSSGPGVGDTVNSSVTQRCWASGLVGLWVSLQTSYVQGMRGWGGAGVRELRSSMQMNGSSTAQPVWLTVQITGMNLYWTNTTVTQESRAHSRIVRLSVVRLTEANFPLICCVRKRTVRVTCA